MDIFLIYCYHLCLASLFIGCTQCTGEHNGTYESGDDMATGNSSKVSFTLHATTIHDESVESQNLAVTTSSSEDMEVQSDGILVKSSPATVPPFNVTSGTTVNTEPSYHLPNYTHGLSVNTTGTTIKTFEPTTQNEEKFPDGYQTTTQDTTATPPITPPTTPPISTPTAPHTTPYISRESQDYNLNMDYLTSLAGPYEIIYPVQYRKNRPLSLDTRDYESKHQNAHYHHTTIALIAFGYKLKLRLELNRELLSMGTKQKYHVDSNTKMISESPLEQCYYQGKVRKITDSLVALSTCYGVSGAIRIYNDTFTIQPLKITQTGNETRHPHVIYRSEAHVNTRYASDIGDWQSLSSVHKGEYLRRLKFMRTQQDKRDFLLEVKHLDLALVLDDTVYESFNYSYALTINYAVQLANILDVYYRELRVRIHLTLIEVWNMESQFSMSPSIKQTLHAFLQHINSNQLTSTPEYHVAQLITKKPFLDNTYNLAIPNTVCSVRAIGVNLGSSSILQTASTVSQSMAVTIGIKPNNQTDCSCTDTTKCFLHDSFVSKPSMSSVSYFSWCNERDFNSSLLSGLGSCMFAPALEESYSQSCGNRIVERGEECDCGYEEECQEDLCCDFNLCLIKPWSTCRFGSCCDNCTIMSTDRVCRPAATECDVPEFCTGLDGECPVNEFVQDGIECETGSGYCYNGSCPSHADQCNALWRSDAEPSVDKCYEEFNPTGSFNGHCGQEEGKYVPCDIENVKCGLLHCSKGDSEPNVYVEKTFSRTTVVSDGEEFQCKIVNGRTSVVNEPELGVVEEGTKCGTNMMCLNRKCQNITSLDTIPCPTGAGGRVCSGNGICTSSGRCFCPPPYYGATCENEYELEITTDGFSEDNFTTNYEVSINSDDRGVYSLITAVAELLPADITTHVPGLVLANDSSGNNGVSTTWLIIVLASVAGGTLLILLFCMCCYRRRSPKRRMRKARSKVLLSKMLNTSLKSSSCEEIGSRIISFGNMPSYRKDKIKKALRKSAVGSESGSEHSHSRDSTLLTSAQIPQTAAVTLASPPERGILKKWPRSTDSLDNSDQNSTGVPVRHLIQGRPESLPFVTTLPDGSVILTPMSTSRHSAMASPISRHSTPANVSAYQRSISPTHSCCSCDSSCSCSSCGSDCKKSDASGSADELFVDDLKEPFSDEDVSPTECTRPLVCGDCHNCDSPHGTAGSAVKPLHLENIDDLIRQIDEHVNKIRSKQASSKAPTKHNCGAANSTELAHLLDKPKQVQSRNKHDMYGSPLRISIPQSPTNGSNKSTDLPPYSSPPPPIREMRSPKRTSSPQSAHNTFPVCGLSPVYRHRSDAPVHPPSYDSVLGSISPASTLQCSPRCADNLDISPCRAGEQLDVTPPVPYRGAQQLSPAPHHRQQQCNTNSISSSGSSRNNSPPIVVTEHGISASYPPTRPITSPQHLGATSAHGHPAKLNNQLLDNSVDAISVTPDTRSTSEGYHSDRHDLDESIIIREIPRLQSPPEGEVVSFTKRKSAVDV